MFFQFASDLHLEFPRNKKYLLKKPLQPKAEILILGGDIMPFGAMDAHADFWNYISDHFKQTYWLPGNHEYYGFDVAQKPTNFRESIRSNIDLLNNEIVTINEVEFIFTTLWSHVSPLNQFLIHRRMNDFYQIKFEGAAISSDAYNSLHQVALDFLNKAFVPMVESNTHPDTPIRKVVVTHHLPTFQHYPKQYINDPIREGFATELAHLIEASNCSHWIFGHHHSNIPSFQMGNTQLHTNQLGYVQYGEHNHFNPSAVLAV
jgi:hypothetical protein